MYLFPQFPKLQTPVPRKWGLWKKKEKKKNNPPPKNPHQRKPQVPKQPTSSPLPPLFPFSKNSGSRMKEKNPHHFSYMKAGTEEEALNRVKIRDETTAQKAKDGCTSRVKNIIPCKKCDSSQTPHCYLSREGHPLIGLKLLKGNCELPFLRPGPQCAPSSTPFQPAHNHSSFGNGWRGTVISLGTDTSQEVVVKEGCPKYFSSFKKSTQYTPLFKMLAFHAGFSSLTPLKK